MIHHVKGGGPVKPLGLIQWKCGRLHSQTFRRPQILVMLKSHAKASEAA